MKKLIINFNNKEKTNKFFFFVYNNSMSIIVLFICGISFILWCFLKASSIADELDENMKINSNLQKRRNDI